jgi:single-strand DNA-binding protein
VLLSGRLVRDPEWNQTKGKPVARFSLAVNRFGRDGETAAADFFEVLAWERLGEQVAQYTRKGSRILVEGRLQWRSWTDESTGRTRRDLEVIASGVFFLDARPKDEAPAMIGEDVPF